MQKGKVALIIFTVSLLCALVGCSETDVSHAVENNLNPIAAGGEIASQQNTENSLLPSLPNDGDSISQASGEILLPDWDAGNEVTPYQFLYLLCGNAEELSFTYKITQPGSDNTDTRSFQKMGDASVESFFAQDMDSNTISVREQENDGKVHYIMDDSKVIKTYLAPADFLLYQMTEAAKTVPDRAVEQDDYMLFEHSLPFEQDETTACRYSFYMQNGVLKKLTVTLGDSEPTNYEFSDFRQEITDAAAFEYPQGYHEENFDYSYSGEHMPPWWDIGNDK